MVYGAAVKRERKQTRSRLSLVYTPVWTIFKKFIKRPLGCKKSGASHLKLDVRPLKKALSRPDSLSVYPCYIRGSPELRPTFNIVM